MAKDKEDDDKGKPEEEGLTIVTDDPKNLDSEMEQEEDLPPKKGKSKEDDEDDEKPGRDKHKTGSEGDADYSDDSDEDEDERLGASEEMEEEKEQKARKKSRRQRHREAEQRLRNEVKFLELRNEKLEKQMQEVVKRQDTSERSSLEGRISQTKALISKAERVMAEAHGANKGEEHTEALKIRDKLRDDLTELERVKAARDEADEAGDDQGETKAAPPPPEVMKQVHAWHKRNAWFDFALRDADSKIVRVLDNAMEEEGWDPATEEYWEELDKRIARHLPDRALKAKKSNGKDSSDEDEDEDAEEDRRERRSAKPKTPAPRRASGGPRFRTGGPGRELKANEVYLSAERIAAMKEAGVWDDPVAREKQLKKYREWDRENAHLYRDQ